MEKVYQNFKIEYRDFFLALHDFFEQNGNNFQISSETRQSIDALIDKGLIGLLEKSMNHPESYARVIEEVVRDRDFVKKLEPYLVPFTRSRKSLNKQNART